MAGFVPKEDAISGAYLRLSGDDEVFGHKDFINDVTVRGDLQVSGDMRVSQIVDFTSESGDISGHIFRGSTAYFDEVIVGQLSAAETSGGSSGETSGGLDTGPVFVKTVNAVNGVREILESEYNGEIIRKVKTASDQIDVSLMVERGDAQAYRPSIFYSVSGVDNSDQAIDPSSLTTHSNGYSFYASARLDASTPKTYLFKNGSRQTYLIIEKDTPPQIISAEFVNKLGTSSFYGTASFNSESGTVTVQQTEARNGDVARVKVVANKAIGSIYISGSAVSNKSVMSPSYIDNLDGTYTHEFDVSVSASNSVSDRDFTIRVWDLVGNPSENYNSDNTIKTNNQSPSGSISISYPNNTGLMNNTTDLVSFNVSANNFDNYNFSNSGIFSIKEEPTTLTGGPFKFSAENASSRTSGNFSVQVFKASNGRTASFSSSSVQVQSFGTVPSLNFSPNLFSSSNSGAVLNNVNVTLGEEVDTLTIDSVSDTSISIQNLTKNNNKSFSFQISVDDSSPRGTFTINFAGTKIIGDSFSKSDTGSIRGFNQRTVTALATAYEPVDLGVNVFNTSRLVVSVQPDGGNSFSVNYDANITGPKQDGTSNLEAAFGIIDDNKIVIDNQVITNAGNVSDVFITVEELQ
tara:strand:- start:565 stop:2463 length:1899 start_codon:yes stop_codon:yes gene_type:complete